MIRPSIEFANLPLAISPGETQLLVSGWQIVDGKWKAVLHRYQLD